MGFAFETASQTHTGKVRKQNEDSLFADGVNGLWVVADGMGGHRDGGIASAMITTSLRQMLERREPKSALAARLAQVNAVLLGQSNGQDDDIIGSTVAALLAENDSYNCVWAGDSRCYLVRRGLIVQISRDHTEVQELVNAGMITAEEARHWHRRNVITRAIGVTDDLQLERAGGEIFEGDCFVLCSDGLTGHVSDAEILSHVTWASAQQACDNLISLEKFMRYCEAASA